MSPAPLAEDGRCALCRLGARGFDAAYTYGSYEDALRKLIHLYKYQGIRSLRGRLSGYLTEALPSGEAFDVVTAVPLHWIRHWRRGFNQAAELARGVARAQGWRYAGLLRRVRATRMQAQMTAAQRRQNVRGVFQVKARWKKQVKGKRILLIDDVLTTGSTLAACAAALRRAGAERVVALAVARVDRRAMVDPFPAARAAGST